MAKKKKRIVRNSSKSSSRKAVDVKKATIEIERALPQRSRLGMVVKNLIFFALLFVASLIVTNVSSDEGIQQAFGILAVLAAFVGVSLIIVLLVFVFIGKYRKK